VRDRMRFHIVSTVDEVLAAALDMGALAAVA
jgi:hypothetical protein